MVSYTILQAVPEQLGVGKERRGDEDWLFESHQLLSVCFLISQKHRRNLLIHPASKAGLSELFLSPKFRFFLRFVSSTSNLTTLSSGSPWLREEKSECSWWPSGGSDHWSSGAKWRLGWELEMSPWLLKLCLMHPDFSAKPFRGNMAAAPRLAVQRVSTAFPQLLGFTRASMGPWILTALLLETLLETLAIFFSW